jgi:hypothetical protein
MKRILLKLLERFSENITHKTGEKASVSGIWRSGSEYIALTKGERFIPSDTCIWVLVVSV